MVQIPAGARVVADELGRNTRGQLLHDPGGHVVGAARWLENAPMRWLGATRIPSSFEILIQPGGSSPIVQLTVQVIRGVPRCTTVTVKASRPGEEVQFKHLKSIRIVDWIEVAVANIAREATVISGRRVLRAVNQSRKAGISATRAIRVARSPIKITQEFLIEVAQIYRENCEDRPVVAIGQRFNVRPRTAAGYVEKARAAGLLPPTTQGKKRA